ncbi:hypothetical protein EVAR_57091_1 [Eumeta japonica]|uniref:Uncharacterized protein n=1 Tax=Eumeta variegata TaxID=151549 RepID=A0A4C1Z4G9_EUMVA|nr:hypothetical protein EVAR_57091_1 [Eumeta japonica]
MQPTTASFISDGWNCAISPPLWLGASRGPLTSLVTDVMTTFRADRLRCSPKHGLTQRLVNAARQGLGARDENPLPCQVLSRRAGRPPASAGTISATPRTRP